MVVSRDEALGMFQENKFKVEIIEGLPADATITLYRVGPMVDLCTGPHLPNSGYLKSVAITNMSRAMWRADASKEPLQRVYGITFPDDASLKDYLHRMEEAKKRDHRNVGTQMELFFFHQLSPGSCFFHPNGTRVYNALITLMRDKYWEYEYDEVVSPNIFNFDLWKTSGHADHYKENMFSFDVEAAEYGLKPMNCPGTLWGCGAEVTKHVHWHSGSTDVVECVQVPTALPGAIVAVLSLPSPTPFLCTQPLKFNS